MFDEKKELALDIKEIKERLKEMDKVLYLVEFILKNQYCRPNHACCKCKKELSNN